jgi:FlaA1/EpsC-like NDP-sugar epimerase
MTSNNPRPILSLSRVSVVALHDLIQATIAFELAVWVRHQTLGNDQALFFDWPNTLTFVVVCAIVFWRVGLYRGIWHYASFTDLVTIIKGVTLGILIFLPALFLVTRLENFPRTTLILLWPLLMLQLSLPRLAYRLLKDGNLRAVFERNQDDRVPVLLVGAGSSAEVFIREMSRPGTPYSVVGIVDDKPGRIGRDIRGVRVLNSIDNLPVVIAGLDRKGRKPQRLLLATEKFSGEPLRKLLARADDLGMTMARLPRLTDFRGDAGGSEIAVRPLAMEDLLGRPQKVHDRDAMRQLINGRRVMITGAGGTIGSELTRQIALLAPSHLTLLDNGEHALYQIDLELATLHPEVSRRAILADVRDEERVRHVFSDETPDLVFHAAAFKHVPLSEQNPHEAVLTNVIGSRNIARACGHHGVGTMVLISTDKAVNPASVMGVSKRLAEMYCQALGGDGATDATRFVTVRFGNVLGSTGSVVPLFQKQIAAGGPVTVTDQDTTRFFMTTREAVELVLQASAMDAGDHVPGTVFVLDMGDPVRIEDLARQMIRLVGLQPDKDIAIQFTGLRAGEKLHEELSHQAEGLVPTAQQGILRAAPRTMPLTNLDLEFDGLREAARREDLPAVIQLIQQAVPEFTPHNVESLAVEH